MSASARQEQDGGGRLRVAWAAAPEWLKPRAEERRGRGELRLIEGFVLVLIAAVFTVATVNDLLRSIGNGERLSADLKGWWQTTGHRYHNPLIEQDVKTYTSRDVVCANTTKTKPLGTTQICLVFTGPVRDGVRRPSGGYYLEARGTDVHRPVINEPEFSYGCFGGAIDEHRCGLPIPPGVEAKPLVGSG